MPRRGSIEGKDKTLFQPNYIFCKRYGRIGVKKQNVWTSEGLTNFEREGGPTIIKIAGKKGDEELLTRIRGEDLFARKVKYHNPCRMRYSVSTKWQSDNILSKQHQSEMEEVHAVCFAKLCKVIDREIIIGKKVMKMTDLRSLYCTYLSETPFANPHYRSEKIKINIK